MHIYYVHHYAHVCSDPVTMHMCYCVIMSVTMHMHYDDRNYAHVLL